MGVTGRDQWPFFPPVLPFDDIESWWCSVVLTGVGRQKGLVSLLMLVYWEIWHERNTRILKKIKIEASLWVLAGAKNLGFILPGD
jgi:hypothetical protein